MILPTVLGLFPVAARAQAADSALIAHYKLDSNLTDEKGLSDGVLNAESPGALNYITGYDSTEFGALLFGIEEDTWYLVDLGTYSPSQLGTPNEMTCSFWAYWLGNTGSWQDIINKRDEFEEDGMMWGINQHDSTHMDRSIDALSVRQPESYADAIAATLVNGHRDAGVHQSVWDASAHPAGLYVYRLKTGNSAEVKRMKLLPGSSR